MARRNATGAVLKSYTAMLPVKLTEKEVQVRGSKLALTRQEAEQHTERSKALRAELIAKRDELDSEIGHLAKVVREKTEDREVECEVRMSKKDGCVDEIRLDTMEVIATRPIKDEEGQTGLDFAVIDDAELGDA